MDAATLDRLLSRIRARLHEPEPPQRDEGCLTYRQLRALALDPTPASQDQVHHLSECPHCRRLLALFTREMPHLAFWTLLRARLGQLSPAETRSFHRHLEEGGCALCRGRYGQMHSLAAATFRGPVFIPHSQAVGAASAGPGELTGTPGSPVEVELFSEEDQLLLEFRTREAALTRRPLGYLLVGAGGTLVEGRVTLRPDVEGWWTGHASFSGDDLHRQLRGSLEQILVASIDPDLLLPEER